MKKITFLLLTILPLLSFGQNLAPNPALNGTSNWSDLSAGTTQMYDAAFTRTSDGSGSWIINSSGGFNSGIKSSNITNVAAGQYLFSYYVYGNAGDKTKPILRNNTSGEGNINGELYTIVADNTWELVEQTFTIGETSTINLRAMVNSGDDTMDFHVDDFSLTLIPPTGNTLTVNTAGAGSVALTLNKVSYDDADEETLTATAATHWNFDSWSGDLTGSTNPETLLMDADKTVTANFTVDPSFNYAFTFDTDGELEGWTMDPQVSVASHTGGLVTLSITENQWSRFNLFDFPISASNYNKVTVVVKNEEPSTDQLAITLGSNNNTNTYPLASQATFQTFEIDLTQFTDWTGDVESFRIRFADADNPTNAGRPTVSHDVVINSVVFSFDATLSSSQETLSTFKMYPNPAKNVLNITSISPVDKVEIYNITGKQVINTKGFVKNTQINVSTLNSGMYLVKLTDNNYITTVKKLILK